MRWYKDLYLGASLSHSKAYYKYLIEHTRKLTASYCIMLAARPGDLLEIAASDLLRLPGMYQEGQLILGIAGTRRESREMAGQIVLDCIQATGGTDVGSYFESRDGALRRKKGQR